MSDVLRIESSNAPDAVMTDAVIVAAFEPAVNDGMTCYVRIYPDGSQPSHRTKGLLHELLDQLGAISAEDELDGG